MTRSFYREQSKRRCAGGGVVVLGVGALLLPFSAGSQLGLEFLRVTPGLFNLFGDELGLQLVHVPAALGHQAPHVPGHARELAGSEDDQEEDSYD